MKIKAIKRRIKTKISRFKKELKQYNYEWFDMFILCLIAGTIMFNFLTLLYLKLRFG